MLGTVKLKTLRGEKKMITHMLHFINGVWLSDLLTLAWQSFSKEKKLQKFILILLLGKMTDNNWFCLDISKIL